MFSYTNLVFNTSGENGQHHRKQWDLGSFEKLLKYTLIYLYLNQRRSDTNIFLD
jgi:hypothetical protein